MDARCPTIRRRRGTGTLGQMDGRHARHRFDWLPRRLVARHGRQLHHRRGQGPGRIRRPDYGHVEIEVTVDDPKAYTRPWMITLKQRIVLDTELVDEICLENEKSSQRMNLSR